MSPSSFIVAGRSTARISVASIRIAAASPMPISFSHTPAGQDNDGECTLGDALPGPTTNDPAVCVISTEELQSLVFTLGTGLSPLEADALRCYLEGLSYEEMAEDLGCDCKTIDNALQRVKRKILAHQKTREVLQ